MLAIEKGGRTVCVGAKLGARKRLGDSICKDGALPTWILGSDDRDGCSRAFVGIEIARFDGDRCLMGLGNHKQAPFSRASVRRQSDG